jgi:hypothetical protein
MNGDQQAFPNHSDTMGHSDGLTKRELGLPTWDAATERQRRDEAVASLGAATFAERPADAVARIVDVLRRWR